MPCSASWEPKDGGRVQLEQKSRVWAGAARGLQGPGWLPACCCLHVRVTLGRSPHLSARQPPSLPPPRGGAGQRFQVSVLSLGLL